jgi:3-hydroxymyristoyl/3-hydroxydecanoyl-(acyl carrier protein) dehydratase
MNHSNLLNLDHTFPPILSQHEDDAHLRLVMEIAPELGWFRGHFPGNPVLPGIVQVHWAVIASRSVFPVGGGPREIKQLKFKRVVTPPKIIELALCRLTEHEVQFDYSSLGQQHSQGRLIFEEYIPC